MSGLTKDKLHHVTKFAKIFNLGISREEGESDTEDSDETEDDWNHKNINYNKKYLKIKAKIVNKKKDFMLSFPKSRTNRLGFPDTEENLAGFYGRVQQEYKIHRAVRPKYKYLT